MAPQIPERVFCHRAVRAAKELLCRLDGRVKPNGRTPALLRAEDGGIVPVGGAGASRPRHASEGDLGESGLGAGALG